MSELRIFEAGNPDEILMTTSDAEDIAGELNKVGVLFERWQTNENPIDTSLNAEEQQDRILTVYADSIERLKAQGGYQTADVVSLAPDHPEKEAFRAKFLDEHIHSEDEVRFFVDGSGLFYLHLNDKVYGVLCTKGDLISVPANTKHWFDMSDSPKFTCIRVFTNPEGWVAQMTGSDIAKGFPEMASAI